MRSPVRGGKEDILVAFEIFLVFQDVVPGYDLVVHGEYVETGNSDVFGVGGQRVVHVLFRLASEPVAGCHDLVDKIAKAIDVSQRF